MTQIAWNNANQLCQATSSSSSSTFVPVTLNANLAMQQMSHRVVGHVDGTVRPESNSGLLEGKWRKMGIKHDKTHVF